MFDFRILPSERFDVPVVCVGNITVGGTGKTPHVEYLIEHLSSRYHIGVLSRGYHRATKGFVFATVHSTPDTIGDEPYQIYRKFRNTAKVAVCESRRKGIKKLLELDPKIDLILLDDAFQHRYVQPKVSVVLMDYNRPIYDDKILPLGRLRESAHGYYRADFVIVTKTPETVRPVDLRLVTKKLDMMAYQHLFFTRYEYGAPQPVFEEEARYSISLANLTSADAVMLLTGIANPRDFVRFFNKLACRVRVNHYPDHHNYTRKDLEDIENCYAQMKGARKIIMTTEKDAVRLANNPYFPEYLKPYVFYLPISVAVVAGQDHESLVPELLKAINAKSYGDYPADKNND